MCRYPHRSQSARDILPKTGCAGQSKPCPASSSDRGALRPGRRPRRNHPASSPRIADRSPGASRCRVATAAEDTARSTSSRSAGGDWRRASPASRRSPCRTHRRDGRSSDARTSVPTVAGSPRSTSSACGRVPSWHRACASVFMRAAAQPRSRSPPASRKAASARCAARFGLAPAAPGRRGRSARRRTAGCPRASGRRSSPSPTARRRRPRPALVLADVAEQPALLEDGLRVVLDLERARRSMRASSMSAGRRSSQAIR